ncbi:hypothetical protein [Campylobacter troglodytis]|nr:hypothetical protein [Campylobacter troglodytis]
MILKGLILKVALDFYGFFAFARNDEVGVNFLENSQKIHIKFY